MKNFVKISKDKYNELLNQASFRTFFHNPAWHEFLEKEFKWLRFEYYLYKNEALLAFGRVGDKLISLPFCEYGGPLLLKEGFNWEQFENDVFDEFGRNIKIKLHPYLYHPQNVSTVLSSHLLSGLKNMSEQEMWSLLRKTLRHEIKNAQKNGLKIGRYENQQELKRFYDLYVTNLRRKKTVPYPWSLVQFLCQNPSNELLLALYKGKIIGGALFLQYYSPREISHYFLSASDYKYRDFGIAHFILWEKVKSLIGRDVVLDLGASPKGSNLEIFKSGWSGTESPIYQIGIKRSEEGLRSSKLRNLWGLLPNWLIKKLSPYLIKYRI